MRLQFRTILLIITMLMVSVITGNRAEASAPASLGCSQAAVEANLGSAWTSPGPSTYYIVPDATVAPFYQWEESNDGYCGEVGLVSAGLANGQWVDQFNTRAVCGGFFGPESGGTGYPFGNEGVNSSGVATLNYNAELLLEYPFWGNGASGLPLVGPYDYDWAGRCANNAGLNYVNYPANTGWKVPNTGLSGYHDYMSWVKAQIIAGHEVTVGVLLEDPEDYQYDHEVNVIKIGTNHSPTDPTYYDDDVIYLDDHGNYTLTLSNGVYKSTGNPSIPLGSGTDKVGCTPYIYAYTFANFVQTYAFQNGKTAQAMAAVMPNNSGLANNAGYVNSNNGNSGSKGTSTVKVEGPHNEAVAYTGVIDTQGVTKPVSLAIVGSSTDPTGTGTNYVANPYDSNSSPATGYRYENPYIGWTAAKPTGCDTKACNVQTPPPAMRIQLQATVHGLAPGVVYNLYEYDFPQQSDTLVNYAAALPIPQKNFNAQASLATHVTRFVAHAGTYTAASVSRTSDQIVVFRAVPAGAP